MSRVCASQRSGSDGNGEMSQRVLGPKADTGHAALLTITTIISFVYTINSYISKLYCYRWGFFTFFLWDLKLDKVVEKMHRWIFLCLSPKSDFYKAYLNNVNNSRACSQFHLIATLLSNISRRRRKKSHFKIKSLYVVHLKAY